MLLPGTKINPFRSFHVRLALFEHDTHFLLMFRRSSIARQSLVDGCQEPRERQYNAAMMLRIISTSIWGKSRKEA